MTRPSEPSTHAYSIGVGREASSESGRRMTSDPGRSLLTMLPRWYSPTACDWGTGVMSLRKDACWQLRVGSKDWGMISFTRASCHGEVDPRVLSWGRVEGVQYFVGSLGPNNLWPCFLDIEEGCDMTLLGDR